jgi:hypothetical protein
MTINLDTRWEPQRDRWGRPLIIPPDGGKPVGYTRATTVAKTLDDEGSLIKWAQRMTAAGLARRPDLLALLAAKIDTNGDIAEHHKTDVQRICDEAKEHGGGSKAANLGTALHALTEQYDLGQTPTVPADLQADIDIYRRTVEPFEVLAVEQFIVLDEHQIGGTFDRLWRLPDGRNVIADLKTGQNLDYSWRSIAVQLAIYAAGVRYHDGQRSPLWPEPVDQDTGIVIHLPVNQGRCDLYQIDLRAGTIALQHSMWARRWRNRKDLATPFAAPTSRDPFHDDTTPAPLPASNGHSPQGAVSGRRTQLRARIQSVLTVDGGKPWLTARWPDDVPTFKQSDTHTDEQLDAIEQIVTQAEAHFAIGFGDHDITRPSDPAPTPASAPARPEWVRPADGRKLSDAAATRLRQSIRSLETSVQAWLQERLIEAQQTGRTIVIDGKQTERSKAIIRAIIAAARCIETVWVGDEEYVRTLLAAALRSDSALFPTNTIGAAFAALTITEAARFADLLEAAYDGAEIPLTFADDGTPLLVLDTAA